MSRIFASLIILFACFQFSFSQAIKIIETPEDYSPPLDYYYSGTTAELNFYVNNRNLVSTKDKKRQGAWIVINDREGNETYKKPDEKSGVKATLGYLDSYIVSELQGEFAHIYRVDGGLPRSKEIPKGAIVLDMGWIKRSKVLQWTMGLVDPKSKISLKGILLNKAQDIEAIIKLNNKEVVKIYDSPYSQHTLGDRNIYEIFYILKRENGRVLLSTEYEYVGAPKNYIIGWVDEARISKWNTRIAIEPNHVLGAFNERKAHDNFRFAFFANIVDTKAFLKTGKIDNDKVLFNQDPVTLSNDMLSKSNPRRYKGSIIRYPILTNHAELFGTGVIGKVTTKGTDGSTGSINTINYGELVSQLRQRMEDDKNVNVFFLVEGSTEMNLYKTKLAEMINELPSKFPGSNIVNVGCGIYRDYQSGQVPFVFKELTQNRKEVAAFVNNEVFYRPQDDDRETVFRYALKKTLKDGGKFQPGQRNILIIVGNGADFANNKIRTLKAEKSEYFVTGDAMGSVYKALADLDMNVIFMQPKNEEGRFSQKFQSDGLELMSETAKRIYNENEKISAQVNIKRELPEIPDCEPDKLITAKAGVNFYGFYSTELNKELSASKFSRELNKAIEECNDLREDQMKVLYEIVETGKSIDVCPGEFQPFILRFLEKEMKGIDPATMSKFLAEKYQLFQEAYLPKKFPNAKYNSYSYVMFLPKNELYDFKNSLSNVANAYTKGYSMSELRQALKDVITDLVLTLSSQNNRTAVGEMDMSETLEIILGLNVEGVVVFDKLSKKELKNLTKAGVYSDEEIIQIAKGFSELKLKLDDIYKSGARYEFCFRNEGDSENLYFWIALDDILDESFF